MKKEILRQIKDTMTMDTSIYQDKNKYISFYELFSNYNKRLIENEKLKRELEKDIKLSLINSKSSYESIIVEGMDSNTKYFYIRFFLENNQQKEVVFSKENNQLSIVNSSIPYKNLLKNCKEKISFVYDELSTFYDLNNLVIKSINTPFIGKFHDLKMTVSLEEEKSFSFDIMCSVDKRYRYRHKDISYILSDYEEEFLKNIYAEVIDFREVEK